MTCFLFDVKFWQMDHVFAKFASALLPNLLLHMHRNGQNSTSGRIFNPKFEIPMAGSFSNSSNTNFGGIYAKIYTCFERKTAFIM